MEKFSRWRDAGTGIQPFLPPVPARQDQSVFETVISGVSMLIKPLTGLVKLAMVGILALITFLAVDMIGLLLVPLKPIHKLYHRAVTAVLLRLTLGIMGFFWIKHDVVSLRRGRSAAAASSSSRAQSSRKPSFGDLIVSNSSSYVDILYLAFRYDPVFTQIYPETLTVRQVSFWKALKLAGEYPILAPESSEEAIEAMPLKEFMKQCHQRGAGPVVVFPEGTTSNNRALLKFIPLFKACDVPEPAFDIHILACKYDYQKFAPSFTVGLSKWSKLGHLFRTCAQYQNTLTIKSLAPEESPSNPSFSTIQGLTSTPQAAAVGAVEPVEEDALGSVIVNLMAQISRFRKTGLGVKDKAEFLDYFVARNNGIRAGSGNNTAKSSGTSSAKAGGASSSTRRR